MAIYLRGGCGAPPGAGGKVIAAWSLARELDRVVDDADAGQHGDIWPWLMRGFRVEKGKLAGQGFHGQVRIAKCAVGGAG